jgi:hypothetical protein
MNYNKAIIAAAVAALVSASWAGIHNGLPPMGRTTTTTHVAVHQTSSHGEPHHGTSAREPLHEHHEHHEPRHSAPPNIHAKIRAARIADLNDEIWRAKALESPISCYSNYGYGQTTVIAQSSPAVVEQKSITICNSNVVINQ